MAVSLYWGGWVRSAGMINQLEMAGHFTRVERATHRKRSCGLEVPSHGFNWKLGSRLVISLTGSKTHTFEVSTASPQRDRANFFHPHSNNLVLLFIFLLHQHGYECFLLLLAYIWNLLAFRRYLQQPGSHQRVSGNRKIRPDLLHHCCTENRIYIDYMGRSPTQSQSFFSFSKTMCPHIQ